MKINCPQQQLKYSLAAALQQIQNLYERVLGFQKTFLKFPLEF
jgi:hypothetical protein